MSAVLVTMQAPAGQSQAFLQDGSMVTPNASGQASVLQDSPQYAGLLRLGWTVVTAESAAQVTLDVVVQDGLVSADPASLNPASPPAVASVPVL